MKQAAKIVTIFVMALTFLSCTQDDTVGFIYEPSFSKTIGKEEADSVTIVMAIDDSGSMLSKVNELSSHLKDMFTGLVSVGWDIDLHVVTCAYYKKPASSMKSASTKSVNENAAAKTKVDLLMDKASPSIDLDTLDNDADERCNQSLEKAWSQIETLNKVNISMLVSNEDDCSRNTDNIKDINGESLDYNNEPVNTCTPVTWGRVRVYTGVSLMDQDLDVWEKQVSRYSESVWLPGFKEHVEPSLIPYQHYVDFFKTMETEGKKKISNFSHVYLPIVVDSNKCLAQALRSQAHKERADKVAKNEDFDRPWNTVANIGYSYLNTFNALAQEDTLFNQDNGDLSICGDLSHIVNNVEKEIKLRGNGVFFRLPRKIDADDMKLHKIPIIEVVRRIEDVESESFFATENIKLKEFGLKWTKVPNTKTYSIDLYFDSPMITYNNDTEIETVSLTNSSLLTVVGGDVVIRNKYLPSEFRENENGFGIKK